MAYVALSRARKLNNVFIISLDVSVLKCESLVINEYNRLKKKSGKNYAQIVEFNNILISNINFQKKQINTKLKNEILTLGLNYSIKRSATETTFPPPKKMSNQNQFFCIRLENTTNGWFANSVIQSLLSCGENLFQKVNSYIMCIYNSFSYLT